MIQLCREREWAAVPDPDGGFRPCSPGEPGAVVDLDRAAFWMVYGDLGMQGNHHTLDP
jgi:hypothetical protein